MPKNSVPDLTLVSVSTLGPFMSAENKDQEHLSDSELDALEDDFDFTGYREQRLEQLKRE